MDAKIGPVWAQGREIERPVLTIVMPARNEEANLPRAYDEVSDVMSRTGWVYEVLIIDNASTDGTESVAEGICNRDSRWRYLRFSRNFTVETSIAVGLRHAAGDAAIILFSDLQDPPDLIPAFLDRWREGYDVVHGVLQKRTGDPWWKAISAKLFYRIIDSLSEVELTPNATDFRLLSRRAIDALNQFDERNRYLRGLAQWIGFRRCSMPYDRRPRIAGKSKAPFFYMINLAANAITSFSIKPLQLFAYAGFAATGLTVVLGLVYLCSFFMGYSLPGLTTVYLLLLAILATLLMGFGCLGEYVGRIYIETKGRPLFLVDRTINLETANTKRDSNLTPTGKAA